MDISELSKKIVEQARGMCVKGQKGLLEAKNITDLVSQYWAGIDFCLACNYPGRRVIKKYRQDFREQHVYMDETLSLENKDAVFLGSSVVDYLANDYSVCRLYVKHDGILSIKARDHAYVMIDALDNALVKVDSESAKVIVNLYSKSRVEGNAFRVINKQRETYEL